MSWPASLFMLAVAASAAFLLGLAVCAVAWAYPVPHRASPFDVERDDA